MPQIGCILNGSVCRPSSSTLSPTKLQVSLYNEYWLMIDVKACCQVFRSGLEAIEGFDRSIHESLDQVEICDTSTYDPIVLPSFHFEATTSTTLRYVYWLLLKLTSSELAEAIAGHLQQDSFAESSDVGLYVSATRQAALQSRRMFLRPSSCSIADK